MSNDYKVMTPDPIHLLTMLQPPNEGATAAQDIQGCETETLSSLTP